MSGSPGYAGFDLARLLNPQLAMDVSRGLGSEIEG